MVVPLNYISGSFSLLVKKDKYQLHHAFQMIHGIPRVLYIIASLLMRVSNLFRGHISKLRLKPMNGIMKGRKIFMTLSS